jgi:hypothetical protein
LGTGLYHIAPSQLAPGIKLWSYGAAADTPWSMLSTASRQQYIELQGGPLADQSVKVQLQPNETRSHSEYWIPTDHELNIEKLKLPSEPPRPLADVPLFGWARPGTVVIWETLQQDYASHLLPPAPPTIDQYLWPPSGMENLDGPFKWAIAATDGTEADSWRLYYGTWLAGRGRADDAIKLLTDTRNGLAKVLLARLLKDKADFAGARKAMEEITEPWLQIHPEVIIERDKILRKIGPSTLGERERWLAKVGALKDEWVIERKVQWLIDMGELQAAKKLLLSTPFQLVHQTYTRTGLWMQVCEKLHMSAFPVPAQLGEDRLARFGAYREYE